MLGATADRARSVLLAREYAVKGSNDADGPDPTILDFGTPIKEPLQPPLFLLDIGVVHAKFQQSVGSLFKQDVRSFLGKFFIGFDDGFFNPSHHEFKVGVSTQRWL